MKEKEKENTHYEQNKNLEDRRRMRGRYYPGEDK
jgi:hypothetical protein